MLFASVRRPASSLLAAALLCGCADRSSAPESDLPDEEETEGETEGEGNEPITQESAPAIAAEVECAQVQECGCIETAAACTDRVESFWEEHLSQGDTTDLFFDPECMAGVLDVVGIRGCRSTFESSDPADAERATEGALCKFFYGTTPDGEACREVEDFRGRADSCPRDQRCVSGICHDTTPASPGEVCQAGLPQPCEPGSTCADADDGSMRCVAHPPAGAACLDDDSFPPCASGTRCEDGLCVPDRGIGEACGGLSPGGCAAGLFCAPEGECQPRRLEGEPCTHFFGECEPPLECIDGSCVDRGPSICLPGGG